MTSSYRKIFIQNISALLPGTALAQIINALTYFLVARALGSEAFGAYAACFALTRLTSVIFNLGLDTWLLREASVSEKNMNRLIVHTLTLKLSFGLIWLVGFYVLSFWLNKNLYPLALLQQTALATLLEGIFSTILTGYKAQLKNHITASLSLIPPITILLSTIYLVLSGFKAPSNYVVNRLLFYSVAIGIGLFCLHRNAPFYSAPFIDRSEIKSILRQLLPYVVSDALISIYTSADITIITLMLGKKEVGLYAPVSNMISALFIIPQAIQTVVIPIFSKSIAQNHRKLNSYVLKFFFIFSITGGALWLVTSLLAYPLILLILGSAYLYSVGILQILSIILFLKSVSFCAAAVLISFNRQSERAWGQAISAFANVGLNVLLIHQFGIQGVAWVYVTSEAVLLLSYLVLSDQTIKQYQKSLST